MMLGLPKATEFNRRIPKAKFYENINITSSLKKLFVLKLQYEIKQYPNLQFY